MLGNVIGLTRDGSLSQALTYEPWGELTGSTGTLADSSRLRWKGLHWEGGNTNLYYVRNRWYDPQARRFTSQDPIGIDGGLNLYTFASNDWVNRSDPLGLSPCDERGGDHWDETLVIGMSWAWDVIWHPCAAGVSTIKAGTYGPPGSAGSSGSTGSGAGPRRAREETLREKYAPDACTSAKAAVLFDFASGVAMSAVLVEGLAGAMAVRAGYVGVRAAVANYVRWSSKKPLRKAGANWATAMTNHMTYLYGGGKTTYMFDVADDMAQGAGLSSFFPFGGISESWDKMRAYCG
jgi:RHS repeat-associated protein